MITRTKNIYKWCSFNSLERGVFNYSGLGGLNDAMRNREEGKGLMTNTFSYGKHWFYNKH